MFKNNFMKRIKKVKNGNEYALTDEDVWVRNFTKDSVPYVDLNETINSTDCKLFTKNEIDNSCQKITWIDSEYINENNIIIVSDGYNFKEKHKLLNSIPKDVCIIGVNGSLYRWENASRNINYYVVNNPYSECLKYLPKRYRVLPKCIASPRTNSEFIKNYKGTKYKYYPVNEKSYNTLGSREARWQIDDYRNPICAAIGLAYKFNVVNLLLLFCDDSFESERAGSVQLENKLWTYPQQKIANSIIDANLYWLKNQKYQEVNIGNCSNGYNLENAQNIKEEDIISFFRN